MGKKKRLYLKVLNLLKKSLLTLNWLLGEVPFQIPQKARMEISDSCFLSVDLLHCQQFVSAS